jgi:UDP-N-acetylmuramyl pentapeptide synthase
VSAQQLLTRILANTLFFLKRREFKAAKFKFLIFTGTVGKTTLREAVTYALRELGIPVESNNLGYSNELGVLLTTLGYSELSLKNPLTWFSLLNKKLPTERFICIELGADFYRDIKWFLKRFNPFAVFISGITKDSWSRDVREVFEERKRLLEATSQSGFIFYNLDDPATVELIQKSNTSTETVSFSLDISKNAAVVLDAWSKNIFARPITEIFEEKERIIFIVERVRVELLLHRSIFEPQVYAILATFAFIQRIFPNRIGELKKRFENYEFSKDRLQMFKAKNNALIIEDSYKATPLCTYWFLDMSARISAKKKILILTEMRPLTFKVSDFYSKLANKVKCAELVYFLGPNKYLHVLQKIRPQVKHLDMNNYRVTANEILKNSSKGDLILLKGSSRYQLRNLRNLLT